MGKFVELDGLSREIDSLARVATEVFQGWRDKAQADFQNRHWTPLHADVRRIIADLRDAEAELEAAERQL